MYNIVLDTNIFLSAFVFAGLLPQIIIDLVIDKKLQLCTSPNLEKEVFRKLRKLKATKETVANVRLLFKTSTEYKPTIKINASRDPNDNFLLELAETARTDFLITRDNDLLELPKSQWKYTKICKPEDFLLTLRKEKLI